MVQNKIKYQFLVRLLIVSLFYLLYLLYKYHKYIVRVIQLKFH